MSSSTAYVLYLTLLHLVVTALLWRVLAETPFLFLAAELLLLGSVYFGVRLYRRLIAPIRLLGQGAAALEDEDFSVKLVPTGSAEMDGVVAVYNNMIDQLRNERVSARQREEFLDQLIDAANLGVLLLDYDGRIASTNEWLDRKMREDAFTTAVIQPSLHPRPRQKTGAGKTEGNGIVTGPGNRRYHVEAGTFIDRNFERGFLIVQDVTAEIVGAEKEAYGKVIRMMAHEVNNSNAAIASVLDSLHEAAAEGDPELATLVRDYLPVVLNRTRNMTNFMRRFAGVIRLPTPDRKPVDLNDMLRATGDLLAPSLGEADIELRYALAEPAPRVEADRAQLEQVIVNAVTNARESIGGGGTIVLRSTTAPVGFAIEDDGPGIPAEYGDRIFTPFFSSKPTGQGVGLTLSRDILEGHGARYGLGTKEDGWTRFWVGWGE